MVEPNRPSGQDWWLGTQWHGLTPRELWTSTPRRSIRRQAMMTLAGAPDAPSAKPCPPESLNKRGSCGDQACSSDRRVPHGERQGFVPRRTRLTVAASANIWHEKTMPSDNTGHRREKKGAVPIAVRTAPPLEMRLLVSLTSASKLPSSPAELGLPRRHRPERPRARCTRTQGSSVGHETDRVPQSRRFVVLCSLSGVGAPETGQTATPEPRWRESASVSPAGPPGCCRC